MKAVRILFCLFVLFLLIATVSAETPTITTVSPTVGYQGTLATVTITGQNFNATEGKVRLKMSGQDNITATISSWTDTQIVCTFSSSKLSGAVTGNWDLVVVAYDEAERVKDDAFAIRPPIKLTSITPAKARKNNSSVDVTVVGSGLADINSMFLFNDDYSNISASGVDSVSSTKVTGTFDFSSKNLATYDVCLKDDKGFIVCDLDFEITSDEVGSLDLASSPSGASVYLDGTLKGTTPITIKDLDVGSYKLILKRDGYVDWTRTAKITNGGTTTYDANLEKVATVTTTTPAVIWTTPPTTVRTTVKSTLKTPTPWPSSTPTTAESPVEPIVIIGALGLAILVLRKQ